MGSGSPKAEDQVPSGSPWLCVLSHAALLTGRLPSSAYPSLSQHPSFSSFRSPAPYRHRQVPGPVDTHSSCRMQKPTLLKSPPLTTLRATSWGFHASHLRPPRCPDVAGASSLFFQKCSLLSCQLCQPLPPQGQVPSTPSSLVSLPVPRDFRLRVGNLPSAPFLPVNTLSGREQRCAPGPSGQTWLIFTASGSGSY